MNSVDLQVNGVGAISAPLPIVLLLTLISFLPAILVTMTCFTRIAIVFHFLRQALGTQEMPSNQVLIGLALFLTIFIMAPVGARINELAVAPVMAGQITVNEGLDSIAIDVDALDSGLIVVPRESVGRAADLPDRAPDGQPDDTPVRARIEQISSVEHAIVVGFPVPMDGDGGPTTGDRADAAQPVTADPAAPTARMTAGHGRPLILTVLEPDEAMRILAGGDAERTRLAAGLLALGAALIAGALLWAGVTAILPAVIAVFPDAAPLVASVFAASPEPSAAAGGDPRSNGQGPGLVGAPGLAILGALAIGAIAVVATTAYVRLTAERPADPARGMGQTGARPTDRPARPTDRPARPKGRSRG